MDLLLFSRHCAILGSICTHSNHQIVANVTVKLRNNNTDKLVHVYTNEDLIVFIDAKIKSH